MWSKLVKDQGQYHLTKTCTTSIRQQLENISTKFVLHNIQPCKTLDRSNFPNYQIAVSMASIVYLDFASVVLCATSFLFVCLFVLFIPNIPIVTSFLRPLTREEHKKHSRNCSFLTNFSAWEKLTLEEMLKLENQRMNNLIVST